MMKNGKNGEMKNPGNGKPGNGGRREQQQRRRIKVNNNT